MSTPPITEPVEYDEACLIGQMVEAGVPDRSLEVDHFSKKLSREALRALVSLGDEVDRYDELAVTHKLTESGWSGLEVRYIAQCVSCFKSSSDPNCSMQRTRVMSRYFVREMRRILSSNANEASKYEKTVSTKVFNEWAGRVVDEIGTLTSKTFDDQALLPDLPLAPHGNTDPEEVIRQSFESNQTEEDKEDYSGYQEVANVTEMGESIWTIAAPTGLGKTSYVLYEAYNMAKNGRPVLYASTEMNQEQIIKRLVGIDEPGVPMSSLFQKTVVPRLEDKALRSVRRMKDYPFFFMDGLVSVREICDQAMRLHRYLQTGAATVGPSPITVNENRLCNLYIDYLQQTNLSVYPEMTKSDKIGAAMTDGRRLSRRMGGRVVFVSQMNREAPKRADKKPTLVDLKDSSAIEQMSNVVAFLHRDSYYAEPLKSYIDKDGNEVKEKTHVDDECSYLLIRKNRNGECPKDIPLKWVPERACYVPYVDPSKAAAEEWAKNEESITMGDLPPMGE